MGFAPLYPRRMRVNQADPGKNTVGKRRRISRRSSYFQFRPTTLSARLFCRYVQTSPLFFFVFNLLLYFFLYSLARLEQVDAVTGDESRGVTVS